MPEPQLVITWKGCGGLAAQHLYGARTGSSMALMGLLKMALALLFG